MKGFGQGGRGWRGRVLRGLVAAGLAAAALAAALVWLGERRALHAGHPAVEGPLAVAGVGAPCEIVRDRRGVAHVDAASEVDAWFALGFVHAQDRPGQMLGLRRRALGRSAEVSGAAALPEDRWARTLGFGRLAEAEAASLPAATRQVLGAYAAGVNAWLERLRRGEAGAPRALAEPVEAVEPWTVADSLAVLKLHAWTMGATLEESLVLADLIERLGPTGARVFFPRGVGFDAVPVREDSAVARAGAGGARPRDPLRRASGVAGASVGSAAFAVAAALHPRGGALLAADSHYEARAPAHLYEAHLRGGALDVAGATLPGIPGFWTGFNPDLVWAATHVPVLVADLVVESLHPADPGRYHDGSRWRSLEVREEEIAVRGGRTERLVVRETRRGPLVHELAGVERPLAVHWTGTRPGRGPEGLLRLARAHDVAEARAALRHHHEPVLDLVLADRDGAGGTQLAGFLPRRELPTGGVPVPARNPAFVWSEALPRDELPRRELGGNVRFVLAADGPLPDGRGIEVLWRAGAREHRLRELLSDAAAAGAVDLEAVLAVQRDVASPGAADLVATALRLAGDAEALRREARETADRLAAWDGDAAAESPGAAAYHLFVRRMVRRLFAPLLGEELLERYLALRGVSGVDLVAKVLRAAEEGDAELADGRLPPETVREAVRLALAEAWLESSARLGANRDKWVWGRLHAVRFVPEARRAWGRRASALGPLPYGGDGSSVQIGEWRGLDGFEARIVPTYRLAADAGDLDQALTALAPGQSEHPGHRHATDGVVPWLRGKPGLLSTSGPVIEDGEVARLRLEPTP